MQRHVLDELRKRTRAQSCVADADAFAFVAEGTRASYVDYLLRSYGFEAPIESACVMVPELTSHTDTSRPRTCFIAHDLIDLGFPAEKLLELTPCPLAPFVDVGQGLGWLYVAERNVMTNRICHRMLRERAPALAEHATYLNCYGGRTEERWHHFGEELDLAAEHGIDPERIVAAALESFEFLHRWLKPPPASTERFSG
jgi:heme oxygenase